MIIVIFQKKKKETKSPCRTNMHCSKQNILDHNHCRDFVVSTGTNAFRVQTIGMQTQHSRHTISVSNLIGVNLAHLLIQSLINGCQYSWWSFVNLQMSGRPIISTNYSIFDFFHIGTTIDFFVKKAYVRKSVNSYPMDKGNVVFIPY